MGQSFIEIADWLDATYEALSLNDIDLFLTAFAPDARWNLLGQGTGMPFFGLRIGKSAIREMIHLIYADFKMRDFFIEDIIANEHAAAVRWSVLSTSLSTGQQAHLEVFDHIIIHEGKIASLTQFFDTAAVAVTAGRVVPVKGEKVS
ncbi:MAG: nuclear transport factor 2 family protein [Bosea sp. (in: a-proteobacteria)]